MMHLIDSNRGWVYSRAVPIEQPSASNRETGSTVMNIEQANDIVPHSLRRCLLALAMSVGIAGDLGVSAAVDPLQAPVRPRTSTRPPAPVPGVIIDHSPQSSGLYIGSPSIVALGNGDYLASHDFFGPNSAEHEGPTTAVFRSSDRGATWAEASRIKPLFWAGLFTQGDSVYIMGTDKHHGRVVIRKSADGGKTWTEPRDGATGLLTPEGEYHTAPVPVVEHRKRLWRGFEDAMGGTEWGKRYRAHVVSAPANSDLLNAANWVFSDPATRDPQWLNGTFNAWLEGNAVVLRNGAMVNVLRVDTPGLPEKAAIVEVGDGARFTRFDPTNGFINFPGGAKKFTIRFDPASDRYWSLATIVLPQRSIPGKPATIRNTLALTSSSDLRGWDIRCILLHHPDAARHGFQYPDWQFDGNDLIAVVRTAWDDAEGGAHNAHDANYLTFHRIPNFRKLTPADSVPIPAVNQPQIARPPAGADAESRIPGEVRRRRPPANATHDATGAKPPVE